MSIKFGLQKIWENIKWVYYCNVVKYIRDLSITILGVLIALYCTFKYEESKDNAAEKMYVKSLSEDLIQDTLNLNSTITKVEKTIHGLDSALEYMQKPMSSIYNIKQSYISIMKYDWFPPQMVFNQRTIVQLKSKSDLHLIRKRNVADTIALYDLGKNFCNESEQFLSGAYQETYTSEKFVYNYKYRIDFCKKYKFKSTDLLNHSNKSLIKLMDSKIKLITKNKVKIIACYNDFANYQASLYFYIDDLMKQRELTKILINLLEKEYNVSTFTNGNIIQSPPLHN